MEHGIATIAMTLYYLESVCKNHRAWNLPAGDS